MARVCIITAGAWGTALACVARRAGNETILWARDQTVVNGINNDRINPNYLQSIALPDGIAATADISSAVKNADAVFLVCPSQTLRRVTESLLPSLSTAAPLVICAKGVERDTNLLMTEVLAEIAPQAPVAVLSGPTFAIEVAQGLPTAVTLAARDTKTAHRLAEIIGLPVFRPYVSDDPIGAEVGGAVKNVLAIACGIVEGRRMGDNTRAALITRGMAEIARLGAAKGAHRESIMGLSGLGDLTLTCNAMQSRNFSLGVALGEGKAMTTFLQSRRAVTEGVFSAQSVTALAASLNVEMPICDAVHRVVNEDADIDTTIAALLARPFRPERHGISG